VAQQANPAARVVYVDSDPIAVAHSAAILRGNPLATIIQADARQPERILSHPEVQRLLDFQQPVAVLLVFLLHFLMDDEEAYGVVKTLREALPAGSYLAISHGSYEGMTREVSEQLAQLYTRQSDPVRVRSHAQIARFFEGLELVEPGLVYIPLWRPEGPDDLLLDQPARCISFAGMGRKA
jgi:hypothetical protein